MHTSKMDAEVLHVVVVFFNYVNSERKVQLIKQLIRDSVKWESTKLYVVELVYSQRPKKVKILSKEINGYVYNLYSEVQIEPTEIEDVCDEVNPRMYQKLYTEFPLFHKENLINYAIANMLPRDWKYVAWIDSDLTIHQNDWAQTAISNFQQSEGPRIIQIFEKSFDLGPNGERLAILPSFTAVNNGYNGHSGYGWACNRQAYEQINGLYDKLILGSFDTLLAKSLYNLSYLEDREQYFTPELIAELRDYQSKFKGITTGYIPVEVTHNYHGDKTKRQYFTRLLKLTSYKPGMLAYNENGILEPTEDMHYYLRKKIIEYFEDREET